MRIVKLNNCLCLEMLLKSVKKQNKFINLHVHLLVEQRGLYKHF